jgi:hypothetical protein
MGQRTGWEFSFFTARSGSYSLQLKRSRAQAKNIQYSSKRYSTFKNSSNHYGIPPKANVVELFKEERKELERWLCNGYAAEQND